jgi:hypothetical protein
VQIEDLHGDPLDEETVYNHALAEWGYRAQLFQLAEELCELQQVVLDLLGDAAAHDEGRISWPDRHTSRELRNEAVDVGIMLGQIRQMWDIDEKYEHRKRIGLRNLAFNLGLTNEAVSSV